MNNKLGIPGIKPINKSTPAAGNHAFVIPTSWEIWSDKSKLEEILVTITAVAIANNKEGICATSPSPTDKNIVLSSISKRKIVLCSTNY